MNKEPLFAGDKIFAPALSHKILEVVYAETPHISGSRKFKAINEYGLWFHFDEYGFIRPEDTSPSVFLATNENRAKIKSLYGIEISGEASGDIDHFKQKLQELVNLSKDFYKLKDNYNGSYYQRNIDSKMYEIIELYKQNRT